MGWVNGLDLMLCHEICTGSKNSYRNEQKVERRTGSRVLGIS
jgi:hypothetical protein